MKVFFFSLWFQWQSKSYLPQFIQLVICYVLSTLGALSMLIIISTLIKNEPVGTYFCGGSCLWPHVQVSDLKSELLCLQVLTV